MQLGEVSNLEAQHLPFEVQMFWARLYGSKIFKIFLMISDVCFSTRNNQSKSAPMKFLLDKQGLGAR